MFQIVQDENLKTFDENAFSNISISKSMNVNIDNTIFLELSKDITFMLTTLKNRTTPLSNFKIYLQNLCSYNNLSLISHREHFYVSIYDRQFYLDMRLPLPFAGLKIVSLC